MKNFFTYSLISVFIIFSFDFLAAKDDIEKLREASFRRTEAAHPTPNPEAVNPVRYSDRKNKQKKLPFLMQRSELPDFLNVNATFDEVLPSFPTQNESSIAVNPTNPKNIIASAVDYRSNSATWVYVSDDGGFTWRNMDLGRPFPGWRSTNDPSVAFLGDGTVYLMYGGFPGANAPDSLVGSNGVFLAISKDEGKTWDSHIPVKLNFGNQTLDSNFEDKYYVEVDNSPKSPYYGNVYTPWKRVVSRDSATTIVFTKSVDGGYNWSEPLAISPRKPGTSEDTTYGQSFPLLTTGPIGEIYAVWNDGIEHSIGFNRSFDGGETWEEPKLMFKYNIFGETRFLQSQRGYRHTVKEIVRCEAYPVIKCDYTDSPYSGNLYLTWAADNPPNVYFAKSTDKGETWTERIIVHKDTTNDQFWQWLSVDPVNGDLAIMYLDSRNDPENILVECYIAYSSDGGETWAEKLVSDVAMDLRRNPFSGNFAGDYSGLDFYNGIAYPSWVDMRNAVTNASINDVFTAVVSVKAPLPPYDFVVKTLPEQPTNLQLSWKPILESSFGRILNKEEILFQLLRDGELIAQFDADTDSYLDTELVPFRRYEYSIRAMGEMDTSIFRRAIGFPAGAREPDLAEILGLNYGQNSVEVEIKLPTLRADKITPLVNMRRLEIYSDNELYEVIELNPNDTGTIYQYVPEIPAEKEKQGIYSFTAVVVAEYEDESIGVQRSDRSNSQLVSLIETNWANRNSIFDFDSDSYIYRATENWQSTDEIASSLPNAFANAARSEYRPQQLDTLLLPLITKYQEEKLMLSFKQICEIRVQDIAFVEYSTDNLQTWIELARFDETAKDSWGDAVLTADDWKAELMEIPIQNGESAYVRFRFSSNVLRHSLGWYLDDITFDYLSSVENNDIGEATLNIFPNPASNSVNILSDQMISPNTEFALFDIFGSEISKDLYEIRMGDFGFNINTSRLISGAYFVRLKDNLNIHHSSFVISR